MKQSIIDYFNKPLLKVSLAFGVITGLLAFLFFLGLYFIDIPPLSNIRYLDIGIYIILMCGGCWFYRQKIGNGFLHLWEALTIGYVIFSLAAILNGWLMYFFVSQVDPAVFSDYTSAALHLLEDGRKTQLEYLSEAEYLNMYKDIESNTPSILIKNEISQRLLMGIVPILIISLIFRRQDYGVFQHKK